MSENVRPNWREIPVVDLTDAELAQMPPDQLRWCLDLLRERRLQAGAPAPAVEPEPKPAAPLDIDRAAVAIMDSGIRIRIYPGEGFNAESFAGEIINPTEQEMRGHGHVSCCWDRAKVVALEGSAA